MTDFSQVAWPDIERAVRAGAFAILSAGATEPHGPHRPPTTDADLARRQVQPTFHEPPDTGVAR